MGVEVVLNEADFDCLWVPLSQRLHEKGILPFGSSAVHLGQTLSGKGFYSCQECTGAVFVKRIVLFGNLAALHGQRFYPVADQKARPLVEADHWVSRIIGQQVQVKDALHAGNKLCIHLADAPRSF